MRAHTLALAAPLSAEVLAYRGAVDAAMAAPIDEADAAIWREVEPLIELGLQHGQQHQELLLSDAGHRLSPGRSQVRIQQRAARRVVR